MLAPHQGYWVPYQQRYLADRSAFKIVNKSRRIGFTEVVCFERACRAAGIACWPGQAMRKVKPAPQNIVSVSLEQSKDVLRRIVNWLRFLEVAYRGQLIVKEGATVVEVKGGIFLRAYSSNPKSIRSFGGDLFLDEFAFHRYQDRMWAAASPLAKANLGHPEGFEIVVVSTPFGDDNRFYEMCEGKYAHSFSMHKVDVHEAVRDGFPIKVERGGVWVDGTIQDLRDECDDDMFRQEYECDFVASSMRYIPLEAYDAACYDDEDEDALPEGFHGIGATTAYGGLDLARTTHRTALSIVDRFEDVNWHRGTDTISHAEIKAPDGKRGMSFDEQEQWISKRIERVSRVAVDHSGMGISFGERLSNAYPGRIELVDFTAKSKEVLASLLKLGIERRKLRPRASDTKLKREVLAMRREQTDAGNVRYLVPESGGGHGDRAWSLALAEYASGGAAKPIGLIPKVTTPDTTRSPVGRVRPGGWQ